LFSNWWKQCSFSDNPNAQKWRRRAFLKIDRKKLVGRRQGFCLQNKNNIIFFTIHVKTEDQEK
jgi:hypothetical protein